MEPLELVNHKPDCCNLYQILLRSWIAFWSNQQDVGLSDTNPILPSAPKSQRGTNPPKSDLSKAKECMKKRAIEYPIKRTIRFTKKEDTELKGLLQKSTYCQTLSELIRDMLFKKELTVNTYNASLQEVKLQLARIRNELQSIGININQITRYFNSSQDAETKLAYAEKVVPHYRKVEGKIDELFTILSQLSSQWSPK